MKYLKLLSIVLLTSMVCLTNTYGRAKPRKIPYKKTKKVEFDLCYDFTATDKTSKVKFITAIPKTLRHKQRIYNIEYSPEPTRFFSANGNDYVEFIFNNPEKQFQIKINIKAKLFRYDLATARKNFKEIPAKDPNLGEFLKSEKYIEKDDPRIQKIAKSIKGRTNANLIKEIQDYIVRNMEYVNDGKSMGALYALENKKGQCIEYADLFVAICRAKGLPARIAIGYTTNISLNPKHAWAEVYLQKYGWIPFDPTWADIKYKSAKQFHYMKSSYLYVSNIRTDKTLHNGYNCMVWGWGGNVDMKEAIILK